jgi:hypothetical protein
MHKRLWTYGLFGLLSAAVACSSSTDSGGGNGGGPTNSPMTVTVEAPQQATVGDEVTYGLDIEDDDGLGSLSIALTSVDGRNDTTITADPDGTSYNWSRSWTTQESGTITLDYEITDEFSGDGDSEEGTRTTDVMAAPADYTVSGVARNTNSDDPVGQADVQLLQNQNAQASTQTAGNGAFSLTVTQDEGTSEDYQLRISKQGYNDYSQSISVAGDQDLGQLMLAPQDVLFTGNLNLQVSETDSAFVTSSALEGIVDFQDARKDTIYLQTGSQDLDLRQDTHNQEPGFWLVPQTATDQDYRVVATSTTAGRAEQQETLDVVPVPEALVDARVIGSDFDELVGRAYAAVKQQQNGHWVTQDSLISTDGTFDNILIKGDSPQLIEFGQLAGGKHYSTIAGRIIDPAAGDKTLDVTVMNRDKYRLDDSTQPATIVADGTFSIDEIRRLHKELKRVNANGGYRLFNDTENGDSSNNRILRFGESSNDPLPDEVIIGKVFKNVNNGNIADLTQAYLDRFVEEYNNKIAVVMGDQAPPITELDTVEVDRYNMREDKGVVFPRDIPGGDGAINFHGQENNEGKIYKNAYIALQSNDTMSDENRTHTSLEEGGAAFIWMGKQSPTQYLTKHESVVHNDANVGVTNIQPMDVKVGRWNRSPYVRNHMDFDGSRADESYAQRLPGSWQ